MSQLGLCASMCHRLDKHWLALSHGTRSNFCVLDVTCLVGGAVFSLRQHWFTRCLFDRAIVPDITEKYTQLLVSTDDSCDKKVKTLPCVNILIAWNLLKKISPVQVRNQGLRVQIFSSADMWSTCASATVALVSSENPGSIELLWQGSSFRAEPSRRVAKAR